MSKGIWSRLTFSDMNPLFKIFRTRPAELSDLQKIDFVADAVNEQGGYSGYKKALGDLRQSPLATVFRAERKSLLSMFFIHVTDVHIAIGAALISFQILKNFENKGDTKNLLNLIVTNPSLQTIFLISTAFACLVFFANTFASSLHAQKIEQEMRLSYRIQMRLAEYLFEHVLHMSRAARIRFQTGDLVNLAQSDARSIASFYAHALVDFPILFISVSVILFVLLWLIGPAAWVGFFLVLSQFPLSYIFSKFAVGVNDEFMRRSDARISLVTEWIQGMRLVRYFGWRKNFSHEIHNRVLSEFWQDLKLKALYCFAFALSTSWWMFVSVGIFGAILYFEGTKSASQIFASIWLLTILGHQLVPLPWFVNIFAEARVGSRRLSQIFMAQTQQEEFGQLLSEPEPQKNEILQNFLKNPEQYEAPKIGFEIDNVTVKDATSGQTILNKVSVTIPAGKMTAIVGPVGSGKSMFLQLLLGECTPFQGRVLLSLNLKAKATSHQLSLTLPVHSPDGLKILRKYQSVVFQEPFVVNSSLRENVPMQYADHALFQYSDNDINNALMQAQMDTDLKLFPHQLETELGERGVNLSGGQKQRLSLARSALLTGNIVFLDDPLSAVDAETEQKLVHSLFDKHWTSGQTILWATHRLEFLNRANMILFFEEGNLLEVGTFFELMERPSRLKYFVNLSHQHVATKGSST